MEQGLIRDELGRFPKGISGNPKGRPKGSITLTGILRREMERLIRNEEGRPVDDVTTEAIEFVRSTIALAKGGSPAALKIIWERMDGPMRDWGDPDAEEADAMPEMEPQRLPRAVSSGLDRVYGTVKATPEDKAGAIDTQAKPGK